MLVLFFIADNSGKLSDNSPGSVTSAQIADEFNALTIEEQEQQRAEWSQVNLHAFYNINNKYFCILYTRIIILFFYYLLDCVLGIGTC